VAMPKFSRPGETAVGAKSTRVLHFGVIEHAALPASNNSSQM